jgi:RND family efflux transporter MFP subunit
MKASFRARIPWILTVVFAATTLALVVAGRTPERKKETSVPAKASQPTARKILYWVDPMHPAYKSDKPGTAPDCGMDLVPVYEETPPAAAAAEKKILYWTDPMTPGYKSDKPGKSPFMDMDLVPVYEEAPAGVPQGKPVAGYSAISLSSGRQQAIGVQLGKAEVKDLTKTIRTVGRVTFDETLLHEIHAKFEGYVERLDVNYTGKSVRKGQPLLSIYSPELLATQQEYLLAVRARRQFQGESNPDVSRGGLDLYESARQRLLLWDISSAQIARLEKTGQPMKALTLYSPVDGFVMTKNAVQGGRVMPSDTLFEIAGIRRVWVLADVYESEVPHVRVGQTARMSLNYLPGRTWAGRVSFIAPVLEEKTRTVKVRVEFDNPDGTLKPEMFADVVLEHPLGRVLTVPDSAVLATGTRALVFVAKGDGRFEPREVKCGPKVDSSIEIREGLQPGEQVVTQANFLIDSESRLRAALAGIEGASPASGLHQHEPPPATAGKAPPPGRSVTSASPQTTPDAHTGHQHQH